jgi:hypothetical protein
MKETLREIIKKAEWALGSDHRSQITETLQEIERLARRSTDGAVSG